MSAENLQPIRDAALSGNIPLAIELLEQSPDPDAAIDDAIEILRDLYWKQKNIQAHVALGKAAIAFALKAANHHPASAPSLRRSACIIAYNVGSFCWNGWDEPGIILGPAEEAAGRELASQHLALVTQFDPEKINLSCSHWLIGAYDLTARNYPAAKQRFDMAAALAQTDKFESDHLLNQGYSALTDLLQSPNPAAREKLNQVKTAFKGVEHGDDYIKQLDVAEKVFAASA